MSDQRTIYGDSSLCTGTCLVFWVSQQQYVSGGDNIDEIQNLTFQDENLRSGLNWLCHGLVKGIF
jgi:hypothetical protein